MQNKYYQKKQVAYIVYDYDIFKNDYEYIKEYYSARELQKDYKIENVRQYAADSIDNLKHLINNRYAVIKEVIEW